MSTSKRHHYLSQFYLKGFLDSDRNWVYDRVTKQLREDIPKNIAVITNYYTTLDEKGERSTEGESLLAEIEDKAVNLISTLNSGGNITYTEKQELSLFIAFLRTRVPQFERILTHIFNEQAKSLLKVATATEERVDHLVNTSEIDLKHSEYKDFMEIAQSDELKVVPHHQFVIASMFKMGLEIAKYLFQMDWFILHSTEDQPIVTCDVPFVILAPRYLEPPYRYGIGIIQKDTVKIIPLTRSSALAMVNHGENMIHRDINNEQVAKLNEILALNSERLLIGSNKELLSRIIDTTGLSDLEPNEYVSTDNFGDSIQGFITATSLNVNTFSSSFLGNLID